MIPRGIRKASQMLHLDELRYVLIPGENPSGEISDVYRAAYRCWSKVWSDTFLELEGDSRIFSDDFTRQTEIGAIMAGDRCIAMGFLHAVDFRLPTARHDSYFKVWSDEAIASLIKDGPEILVASHLTVDAGSRGDLGNGLYLKDLIVGLVVKSLLASRADAMTGTMRCNRGAQRSAYQYGATAIQKGVIHHGVEVDIVAFYRRHLATPGTLTTDLRVEVLWRGREIIGMREVA
jgi:hypothetical protein